MTSATAAYGRDYPDHTHLKRLRHFLTWLAATIAVAVAVVIPAIYLMTAYRYETLRIERTAQDLSQLVSAFVYRHPDLWEFSTNRLEKILLSRSGDEQLHQLLRPNGEIIATSQPISDGSEVQISNRFSIEGYAEVFNGQIVIGTIRVAESLAPILAATGGIAGLGSLLAAAVFIILRSLPLRVLDNALNHLQRAHADLRARVARHETTEAALILSEERFRSVVNNSPTKIHIQDTEGRYLLVNSEAEKLFGVTEEEAMGKTIHEIFTDKQAEYFGAHDQAVLDTGQAIEQEELWELDDGVHTYLTVKFPIRDSDGDIVAIGAIGTDITERKRAERAMHTAKEDAEIANRAKSEFLAIMSHELRTPLNAIIGFSEIINSETFGPVGSVKYRDYAGDIHASGRHLLDLINDILDISKIESGADELQAENIDIPNIVRSIMRLIKELAQTGNIELESDVPDNIPLLRADERKVKQILVNLLSNAIKFTPSGGKITLKIWSRAESGFVFQVIDSGIGIALEDIPKAFAAFQQIDSGLNRKHEGTGLGLPLTKSLVEMHGGSLDLQSEVGIGTTVTVRFPAERIVCSPRDNMADCAADKKAGLRPRQVSIADTQITGIRHN